MNPERRLIFIVFRDSSKVDRNSHGVGAASTPPSVEGELSLTGMGRTYNFTLVTRMGLLQKKVQKPRSEGREDGSG